MITPINQSDVNGSVCKRSRCVDPGKTSPNDYNPWPPTFPHGNCGRSTYVLILCHYCSLSHLTLDWFMRDTKVLLTRMVDCVCLLTMEREDMQRFNIAIEK
jgi:hypothetical protein